MEIEITGQGAFSAAMVHLAPGETFVSESGAMYRTSPNVDIDVTTKTRGKGGILGGLKRLLAAEHFFFSTYRTTDGQPGEVGLAPVLPGELRTLDVSDAQGWVCAGGSYLGCTEDVGVDTRFQGFKGFLTGESLFFLHVTGHGSLLVNAFGRLSEVPVDGELIVDTGHVVAFEDTLDYSVTKAGGSWIQSFLGGEGVVLNFKGQGRVVVQSHNEKAYGTTLGSMLPPRQA